MVKVTALYRWFEGAQFNHTYDQSEHMRITCDAVQPHGLLRADLPHYTNPELHVSAVMTHHSLSTQALS